MTIYQKTFTSKEEREAFVRRGFKPEEVADVQNKLIEKDKREEEQRKKILGTQGLDNVLADLHMSPDPDISNKKLAEKGYVHAGKDVKNRILSRIKDEEEIAQAREKIKNIRTEESRKWQENLKAHSREKTIQPVVLHKGEGFGHPYPKRSPVLENPPKKPNIFKRLWNKIFG